MGCEQVRKTLFRCRQLLTDGFDQGARPEPIGARTRAPVPSSVILKAPPGGHCWILMPESLTTLAQCASCDVHDRRRRATGSHLESVAPFAPQALASERFIAVIPESVLRFGQQRTMFKVIPNELPRWRSP
jgi:hypothetical protein